VTRLRGFNVVAPWAGVQGRNPILLKEGAEYGMQKRKKFNAV